MSCRVYALVALVIFFAGCASTPPKPYWDNPEWVAALNTAIRSSIRYPYPLKEADNGWPTLHAIMQFTYQSRQLHALRVIKSTGSDKIDYYIARQIMNVKNTPWPYGSYAPVPHTFQVTIDLKPTQDSFYEALHNDIEQHAHYPFAALLNKQQGWLIVSFGYRDGMVSHVAIIQADASKTIENAVINEFKHFKLPPPPKSLNLAGKTLHFTVPFCYLLQQSKCFVNYSP